MERTHKVPNICPSIWAKQEEKKYEDCNDPPSPQISCTLTLRHPDRLKGLHCAGWTVGQAVTSMSLGFFERIVVAVTGRKCY